MVSLSYFLIALLCTLPFLLFLNKWRRSYSGKTPPPSPPKLPVIGNLHQLGLYPHRYLQSLSRRYGPLMQLHFGSVPVLVASSPEAAREIMKNQDIVFSNRPKMSIANRLFFNNRDVAFTQYGEYWRQIRSICVLQLLSNKRVQSFRRVREEETSIMVEKIMQLGSSSSTPVNLSELLLSLTNDVVCRVTLGKKYGGGNGSEEVDKLKEMLTEIQNLMGISPVWEFIPWLNWTRRFDGVDQRVDRIVKAFDGFLESVIQEHKERDGDKDGDGDGALDFVDILLQFQRENKNRSPVEDDTVKALILDMFVAGTDTTATALEWAVAELIKNPRAMKRLQNEVREVAGSKAEIEEEDLEKMPYLKASIKESLRLHVPVVLLVPRESTRDTNVLGYDIASGTRVLINAWAIARDPSVWENPEEFLPERFLDSSIDYKGLHFELLPFGAGRRGCPGATFAVAIDELALAKLVHKFDFGLPNGARMEELDMSETSGMTVHKKSPLLLLPIPHHAAP
uniref:Cytochrome P450 n=1 Tax=Nepeta racemosa TaxID=54731 RepID=O04163_NEPRA|nr:cytochrome P450 [Nepeta racemosa]